MKKVKMEKKTKNTLENTKPNAKNRTDCLGKGTAASLPHCMCCLACRFVVVVVAELRIALPRRRRGISRVYNSGIGCGFCVKE